MDGSTLNPQADESQGLDPDLRRIVQLLEAELGQADQPPSPLDGGITNRNYRVSLGGSDYVVRMPGKDTDLLGIDRAAERQANDRAAAIGIAPAVAAMLGDPPCIVTAFVEGRAISAEELLEPATLAEIAATLRALHDRCRPLEASFDPFRIVENYAELVRERGGEVPGEFERAHEVSRRIEAALGGADHDAVPCHNDLLIANLIRGDQQLWLVDWEYAGMGDRYFDLANFAVNNQLGTDDRRRFLALYFEREPRQAELAALELMALMSDFREAMWGLVQSVISEIEFDFGAYGTKHFERLLAAASDEAFERRLEEAGDGASR